jgi:hypothetical protein
MPFSFLHSLSEFITSRPIQRRVNRSTIIETVNDCGEKRYIEMEREIHIERKRNLDVLLTKCKRLLSFIQTTQNTDMYDKMHSFVGRVRQAIYKGDDITPLIDEYENLKNTAKRSSKTFTNLSDAM